ncbi:MAG: hypothetical protein IJR82_02960 [Bacilli bacterium]|nr:hypothetical protein [Bacilli bacterium]
MKLLLSHIADLDGVTPVILLNLLEEEFEYQLFEVGELSAFIFEKIDSDYFDKYDTIYITDLGITRECADKIIYSKYIDKFKLFDHHESHYYLNDYDFAIVTEEHDGYKECGTTLFYNYLIKQFNNKILKKESVIYFVELVRENDTWQFTDLKEESFNLTNLFDFYGRDNFIDIYSKFLKENKTFYFNKTELVILKSLNRKKQEYLESMKDKVIFKEIKCYKIGFVFAELYRSSLGNYLAQLYYDKVDFIAIVNLNRHISFRGRKESIPTNKFAEIFGGGGHPLASAMDFPSDLKERIIDYIYGEECK